MANNRITDIEDELEMKSGENNRLRKQVTDLEAAMQDLYVSRKGTGDLQIELGSLKKDNERLLGLLKETSEYADFNDTQIMNAAGKTMSNFQETKSDVGAKKSKIDNDWIPTEAVRAIMKIRDDFKGTMTETAVSQILYELNAIWRTIMRKETDAIKKRLTDQIQDLRRQVVTKQAFDKSELMKEISRTKKELAYATQQLHHTKASAFGDNRSTKADELEKSIKVVETIGIQKRVLEEENEELRSKISELMAERDNMHAGSRRKFEQEAMQTFSSNTQGVPALNLTKSSGRQ